MNICYNLRQLNVLNTCFLFIVPQESNNFLNQHEPAAFAAGPHLIGYYSLIQVFSLKPPPYNPPTYLLKSRIRIFKKSFIRPAVKILPQSLFEIIPVSPAPAIAEHAPFTIRALLMSAQTLLNKSNFPSPLIQTCNKICCQISKLIGIQHIKIAGIHARRLPLCTEWCCS